MKSKPKRSQKIAIDKIVEYLVDGHGITDAIHFASDYLKKAAAKGIKDAKPYTTAHLWNLAHAAGLTKKSTNGNSYKPKK